MSFITPGHVRAFRTIRSQLYHSVTLASCTINGEPGVAIVTVDYAGETKVAVMPLFVAITDGMEIEFVGMGERDGAGGNQFADPVNAPVARLAHQRGVKDELLETCHL